MSSMSQNEKRMVDEYVTYLGVCRQLIYPESENQGRIAGEQGRQGRIFYLKSSQRQGVVMSMLSASI